MAAVNQTQDKMNTDKIRIHIEDPLAITKFSWDLLDRLERYDPAGCRPKILLCIGTDRSTGDSLGPLVGSKVAALNQDFFVVYGTLDQPVHASNLKEKLTEICRQYRNPFIVAVDACLGNIENVGCLNIGNGSLQPGAGVNKNLPPVGEIHITGIVNVGGFMEYMVLQNTRLNLVMRMADTIVEGLMSTVEQIDRQKACLI